MFKHFISLILITYLSSTCVNANIISTCARSNLIALTFDDGPSWDYANILYILKQNDIKATFFLVGRQLNGNSELTRRAIQEGHNIGSHTYSHPSLTSLNSDEIRWQLGYTNQIIKQETGLIVKYMRPPYGNSDNRVVSISNQLGQIVIMSNIDTNDWENVDGAYEAIDKNLWMGQSSIILMHDWTGISKYLQSIINLGKKKGYKFVNMDECLKASE